MALGRRVRPTKLCTGTGKSERLVSESSTNKIRTQALQHMAMESSVLPLSDSSEKWIGLRVRVRV